MRAILDSTQARFIQDHGRAQAYRVLGLLAIGFVGLTLGACQSASPAPQQPLIQEPAPTTSEARLYLAILQEFKAQGWEIATASERFHTVATTFEPISARLRQRRIGSILFLPKGAALRVRVEHQRDTGPDGSPQWEVMDDEATHARVAPRELELARAIEKRFHSMR